MVDFTDEQLNALKAKGKVLVSAAAGSGKTAVLVNRAASLMLDPDEPIDADRLLIVTFTRAAAAEMKSRISKIISEKAAKNPNSASLRRQQLLLSRASIGTIDSFCISLAREYYYMLDISPDFKIASAAVEAQINEKALNKVLSAAYEQPNEGFTLLLDYLQAQQRSDILSAAINKVYKYTQSLPFEEEYIQKVKELYSDFDASSSPWVKELLDETRLRILDEYEAFKTSLAPLKRDEQLFAAYGEALVYMEDYMKLLVGASNSGWDGLYKLLSIYNPPKFKSLRDYPDYNLQNAAKELKDGIKSFINTIRKPFYAPFEQVAEDVRKQIPAVNALLDLTSKFGKVSYEMKREKDVLTFSDVAHKVLGLLTGKNGLKPPKEIADELKNRYEQVLVDEYQDTNDLQNAIFNALSDSGRRLYMVGDVKQSIYGFRDANPGNFLDLKRSLPEYKQGRKKSKVNMRGNFRSAAPICEFVNFFFSMVMTEHSGGMSYGEEDKLVPMAKFEPMNERVSLHIIDGGGDKPSKQCIAAHTAKYIRRLIESKTPIRTDDGGTRQVRYGDIAVLMRSHTDMEHYERSLSAQGIPVWASKKGGLLSHREIKVMQSMLSAIDNPSRDVPLMSLMMSELYGFSADEVARIHMSAPKQSLYAALVKHSQDNDRAAWFLQQLRYFVRFSISRSVCELITEIYEQTGYINTVLTFDDGERRQANLRLLYEMAAAYEQQSTRGLNAFVRHLASCGEQGTGPDTAMTADAGDAVKLMTIHRSKGLQFPVCILCDMSSTFNSADQKENLRLSRNCMLGIQIADNKRSVRYSPITKYAITSELKRNSAHEELRLLYVAMTRAQDYLTMICSCEDAEKQINDIRLRSCGLSDREKKTLRPSYVIGANAYSKWLLAATLHHPDAVVLRRMCGANEADADNVGLSVTIYPADEIETDETADENKITAKADKTLAEDMRRRIEYVYPYEQINTVAAKQTASGLAHTDSELLYACTAVPLFLQGGTLNGAQRGTAAHKFLQFCRFEQPHNINREIKRLESGGYITADEAKSLNAEKLEEFFKSELFSRIMAARYYERESSFMVELEATSVAKELDKRFAGEKVVIQGKADLVFCEQDELVIVDYKTDRVDHTDELKKRYSAQLELYKAAMEKATGMRVKELILYSIYLGKSAAL